jgi:two-component system phosphate regulon response regulator PhoB/two-component system alkaline phosphatase synthesis response regulator PhoP
MKINKILVVDDEDNISSYLSRKLSKLGYEVFVASDGETAIDITFTRLPDIVLLDVKLPKMNGYEVCRKIKANQTTCLTPVIMLSAKTQGNEIQQGLDAGCDLYLTKPIGFPDILQHVRSFEE